MKRLKTPVRLAVLSAMASIPAACATTTPTSSSVTIQAMHEAVALERRTVCEATRPGKIERAYYDASPAVVREKIAADVAAWAEVCG